MPKIYVASSWRNPYYEQVVKRLREGGMKYMISGIRRMAGTGSIGLTWTRTPRIGRLRSMPKD